MAQLFNTNQLIKADCVKEVDLSRLKILLKLF